jgi:hypothetical protein
MVCCCNRMLNLVTAYQPLLVAALQFQPRVYWLGDVQHAPPAVPDWQFVRQHRHRQISSTALSQPLLDITHKQVSH